MHYWERQDFFFIRYYDMESYAIIEHRHFSDILVQKCLQCVVNWQRFLVKYLPHAVLRSLFDAGQFLNLGDANYYVDKTLLCNLISGGHIILSFLKCT